MTARDPVDKDIMQLRKEKNKAISETDIKKARIIDREINKLKQIKETKLTNNEQIFNRIKYNMVKEKISSKILEIERQILTEQTKARTNFQNRLNDIYKRQHAETEASAIALQEELKKLHTRPVTEAETMKEEAQNLARMGLFEEAETLYQRSNELRKSIIEEKIINANKKYYTMLEETKKKQEEEVSLYEDKMNKTFNDIQKKYELEIENKAKELKAAAIKYNILVDEEVITFTMDQNLPKRYADEYLYEEYSESESEVSQTVFEDNHNLSF